MFAFNSQYDLRQEFQVFDDFLFVNDQWTLANDGGTGTNLLNDAAGGTYSIVTAAADNDYHVLHSDAENFKFAAGKPLQFGCRLSLTEAATDDANIVVGLADGPTDGGIIQNNGAGPPSSFDGALFYKIDGTLTWFFQTANGSTKSTTSLGTFVSGATYEVGFLYRSSGASDTKATIVPVVNGTEYAAHEVTISGLDEMHVIAGVKAGGGAAESLVLDWIGCRQTR
jgi:hypothetical protein